MCSAHDDAPLVVGAALGHAVVNTKLAVNYTYCSCRRRPTFEGESRLRLHVQLGCICPLLVPSNTIGGEREREGQEEAGAEAEAGSSRNTSNDTHTHEPTFSF